MDNSESESTANIVLWPLIVTGANRPVADSAVTAELMALQVAVVVWVK